MLTDAQITALIECRKIIVVKPKKDMVIERAYFRNDMKLQSSDKLHNFGVFMRQNIDYPENFSIGLDYSLPESSDRIILLRCNGIVDPFVKTVKEAFLRCENVLSFLLFLSL